MRLYDYVIFHKGCFDGFSSYVILNNTGMVADDAIIYPDMPSAKSTPPNIDGKNIIIMDVAYKYDIAKEIFNRAKYVTFIDHHITIHDDVSRLEKEISNPNITIIYDESECGASLTWKYFHKNKKMPLFIDYVKDNDIGAWKLQHTHSFMASLETKFRTIPNKENLAKWDLLYDNHVIHKLIDKGDIYREYIDHLLHVNSKKYSLEYFPSEKVYNDYSDFFKKPLEYKVAVFCGNGCPNTSQLGLRMCQTIECDFAIMWTLHMDRKEYVLAFRSMNTDVGKIAQIFGGGGHTLASACSFPISKYRIEDLFHTESLPRQSK